MSYFGVDKKEMPRTVLADLSAEGSMKKYHFTGSKAHRLADLRAFESAFLRGDLSPDLKSEEDKPSNDRGKAKVLVGKSFASRVDGKDALVMFHAPWCGHCKALAPTWDDLGEALEANDHVVIAKMDATANEIDVPGVVIKGFPTIYFFPEEGSPAVYEGGREVVDFVAFLKERAVRPFEVAEKEPKDEL